MQRGRWRRRQRVRWGSNISENKPYDACIQRAADLIDSKEFDEAVDHLLSAESDWKKTKLYQAYLGYAYFYTDEFGKAILCFDKVLSEVEAAENILFMRGLSFDRLDDVESALKDYLQVLKINPEAQSVHRNIGLLYESLGNLQKAKDYYELAFDIDDNDPGIRQRLAGLNF